MSDFSKLRALILAVHLAGIVGVVVYWNPVWLGLTLVSVVLFTLLGQELYCHRYLGHRAFELSEGWQKVFAFFSIFNLFGNPIGIASTHVNHHKHADTALDPHPAATAWQTWFWMAPGFEQSRSIATVKRLMRDAWLVFIRRYYFAIYFAVVGTAALIDIRIAIYGFFLPVIYSFFCNGVINVLCHKYGYRLFATNDNSKNNLIANVLLLGNGVALHNTHHAEPWDYRLTRQWYEVDAVALLIDILKTKD